MANKYKKVVFFLFLILSITLLLTSNRFLIKGDEVSPFDPQPDITVVPELNISRFAPYTIEATGIPGTPNRVSLKIDGLNGDGGECWDYYADGTCGSESRSKNMTLSGDKYVSENVYPDTIYPEIYFADSDVTWYNQPSEMIIRRNDYHIMHFNNPFTMTDEMSFFIEFNADPVSTVNSADLEVYLVEKENNIDFFQENWISDATKRVELVGTFSKDSPIHHTHTGNSTHRVVQLATDEDGKIGSKELDINGDFWVVLYSNSPNNNRGWRFKYHGSSLCNNSNQWYRANRIGWSTTSQSGCPDAHVHIARRHADYMDGMQVLLTAEYDEETLVSEPQNFFFGELPNLPPSSTSFTSPTVGGTYSDQIDVVWEPATDPNNDSLTYNIFLNTEVGEPIILATGTSNTTLPFLTTSYSDGNYSLSGEICDGTNPCVDFNLGGTFTISNDTEIQSITSITLTSSNQDSTLARLGDTVTLAFSTSGAIVSPMISLFSGGDDIENIEGSSNSNLWMFSFVVEDTMTDGDVTFTVYSPSLDTDYFETTDESFVVIDTSPRNYTLSYLASSGGNISGELIQTISHGKDGTSVTANPNEGFVFLNWSDDIEKPTRQDTNIISDITVTAFFIENTTQNETVTVHNQNEAEEEEIESTTKEIFTLLAKTGFNISKFVLLSLIPLSLYLLKKIKGGIRLTNSSN